MGEEGLVSDAESTSEMLTDLEKRVKALRIWSGLEEERKMYLLSKIRKRKESLFAKELEGYGGEGLGSRRSPVSIGFGK